MRKFFLVLFGIYVFGLHALAGDFEEGLVAAQRGDFATAFQKWMPLAEGGDPYAQYNIGRMYRHGDFVDQDDTEAAKWYLKSAEQGLPSAQMQIGWMFANGVGVPRDLLEAVKWSYGATSGEDETAKENLTRIQEELGWAYMGGHSGLEQDNGLACMWFTFAAENGSPSMSDAICAIASGEAERIGDIKGRCISSGFSDCE